MYILEPLNFYYCAINWRGYISRKFNIWLLVIRRRLQISDLRKSIGLKARPGDTQNQYSADWAPKANAHLPANQTSFLNHLPSCLM